MRHKPQHNVAETTASLPSGSEPGTSHRDVFRSIYRELAAKLVHEYQDDKRFARNPELAEAFREFAEDLERSQSGKDDLPLSEEDLRKYISKVYANYIRRRSDDQARTPSTLAEYSSQADAFLYNDSLVSTQTDEPIVTKEPAERIEQEALKQNEALRSQALDRLLETFSQNAAYADESRAARDITHEYRLRLAERIAPALNATIQQMPQATLEEKKTICDFVNGELEPLGLAVQCPNTGLPGKLKATSGSWPGVGRFYVELHVDGKQKKSTYSDTLPDLVLMDAYPPKELGTVREILGTKSKAAGHSLP
jgi:hypothetical protein